MSKQQGPCSMCGYGGEHPEAPPCTSCPAYPKEIEENTPLTLDELRKMDGDKIYIQFIGILRGFYDDEYAPYYGQHEQYVQKYNGMLRACDLPLKYYGESWLAYRRKPGEEGHGEISGCI